MRYRLRHVALLMLVILPPAFLAGCTGSSARDNPGGRPAEGAAQATERAVTPHAPVPGKGTDPTPAAVANEVTIDNFAFQPAELTISVGTRVTWVNRDDVPHTATDSARPRRFDSGTLDTDGRYAHDFSQPGTYEYFCAVHPHMTGRIIVK